MGDRFLSFELSMTGIEFSLNGHIFYNLSFQTRQLKCLYEIYEIMYEKDKKVIKPILFDYIDYIVIAY